MKISVSLATYNGDKFLDQQLNSLLNQTRLPDELIICDDGSNDLTSEILQRFKKKSPFKCDIYLNLVNKGTGFSFKKAIDLCSGDVVLFCDQDDIWLTHKIEIIEKTFYENPRIDFVITNASIVDMNSNYLGYSLWKQKKFTKKWKHKFNENNFQTLFKKNIITGMSTAISSKVIDLGKFKPDEINHDAWYIYLASITGLKGVLVDEPLTLYRQHNTQQFGSRKLSIYRNFKRLVMTNKNSIKLKIRNLIPLLKYVNKNTFMVSSINISYVNSVLVHYNYRQEIINSNPVKRAIMIANEAIKGNYKRFSNQKNIIIDLFCKA